MKRLTGRRWWGTLAIGLVLGLVIVGIWVERRTPAPAPIALSFDGLHTTNDPAYPYGLFTITNRTQKPIQWNATVEAPADPRFEFQQGLSSLRGGGILPPGGQEQFQMLVAGKPGVPFRLVVVLQKSPSILVRLWLTTSEAIPALKRLWTPPKVRSWSVPSEWWFAPAEPRRHPRSPNQEGRD